MKRVKNKSGSSWDFFFEEYFRDLTDVEEDSIILMQDIHSGTPEGLEKVLAYL